MNITDSIGVFTDGFSATNVLYGFWNILLVFLKYTWWLWVFFIVWKFMMGAFFYWRREAYRKKIRWVVLELVIPRLIEKSPRLMDQFFQALHALRNDADHLDEKYIDGETTQRYSVEMASFEGQVHFYMRIPAKQRDMIEAAFLSYYPDVELIEIEDYMKKLPQNITDADRKDLDIWVTEFYLDKSPCLPIKTYIQFENMDEQHQFDPMSTFLEVMARVKKGEYMGMQIVLQPLHRSWNYRCEPIVEELREPKYSNQKQGVGDFQFQPMMMKSPGETDDLKTIEQNLSKPIFVTIPRVIYLAPKLNFYDGLARRGLKGAFNQYSSKDMNYFKDNVKVSTKPGFWDFPYVFPEMRRRIRKQRLLQYYIGRAFGSADDIGEFIYLSHWLNLQLHTKPVEISTEAVASLFHPPSNLVLTAPHTARSESRKVGPSAGLPIYGEEDAINKFYPKKDK